MERRLLIIAAFSLLFANLLWAGYLVSSVDAPHITGRAQSNGYASFCINNAPTIGVPCNTTVSQGQSVTCQLNLSDADGHNVTVLNSFLVGGEIFNVTSNGSISYTPNDDAVGNYSVYFIANDGANCSNSAASTTYNFTVLNINDPPVLIRNLTDQEFRVNTSLSAFFLNAYFLDPDGDSLNYTSTTPSGFSVTILSSSEVIFSSQECVDNELITFTATDPYNESADSNTIEIEVDCDLDAGGGSGDTEGTGGGSGGGAANLCTSEWECQDWWPCLPTGFEWRRCYDTQGCEQEKYMKRACEYVGPPPACIENWLCEEWGPCFINNTQQRLCIDLSACGTTLVAPAMDQGCVYLASCFDGIQNGDETGVDCGGSCASCALVQRPGPIEGDAGLGTWLILLVILAILISAGIVHYYRAQVAQALVILGFLLERKIPKDVLLDALQRRNLFERILSVEAKQGDKANDDLSDLIRVYVQDALGLPFETYAEEVAQRCKQLGLHVQTTTLITSLFARVDLVEGEAYDPYLHAAICEELRTVVCLTSEYGTDEITRPLVTLPHDDTTSFFHEALSRTVDIHRAVQFGQLDIARQSYVALLSLYDGMTEEERERAYDGLRHTYDAVKLAEEIVGSRVIAKAE